MEKMNGSESAIQNLQAKIGFQFGNPDFLKLALTHRSFNFKMVHPVFGHQSNNEQLEFFGDALLGVFVSEELLKLFPNDAEGQLSKKRSHIVDQKSLCEVAFKIGLDEALILGPGEHEQGSHKKPRVLASAFEALISAIYFDSGIEKAKMIAIELLKHNILNASQLEFDQDFKTQLQELTQKMGKGLPTYKELSSRGPSHQPEFLISLELEGHEVSRAVGSSKKRAEQTAAREAFKSLSQIQLKKEKILEGKGT